VRIAELCVLDMHNIGLARREKFTEVFCVKCSCRAQYRKRRQIQTGRKKEKLIRIVRQLCAGAWLKASRTNLAARTVFSGAAVQTLPTGEALCEGPAYKSKHRQHSHLDGCDRYLVGMTFLAC